MQQDTQFKTVISAEHRLFDLHLREVWAYRDLVGLMVRRDFVSKYKQTVLGPLWAILQPLLTTFVFQLIFGSLAGLTVADSATGTPVPRFLFYLSGSICWHYFSTTLNAVSNTFIRNRATMSKVYYPRLAASVATALSGLISFAIQFVLLLLAMVIFLIKSSAAITFGPALLLLPVTVLQLMLLSMGLGIIISAVTTKYRDLAMLVTFGLQLWQYASPVAYGLQLVPERYLGLYLLNPVTPILTTFRYAMFGTGFFSLPYYLLSLLVTVLLLFVGLILFSRIERSFVDTL